jgi:hypothetical protein
MNYKNILENPYQNVGCGVPDDRTLLSGKIKTRNLNYFSPTALSGATSNLHSGAMFIRPYPNPLYLTASQTATGATTVTDLNAAGSSTNNTFQANGLTGFYSTNGSSMVRLVAAAVTVTYEGTEVNRAGRYYAGLLPISHQGFAPTGGAISPLSTLVPVDANAAVDLSIIKAALQCATTSRVSDADFKVVWKPGGTPSYQRIGIPSNNLPVTVAGGGTLYESFFAANAGAQGNAYGDMVLVIIVENDYVGSPSGSGNLYGVNIDAHWELVPDEQFGVVYPLTPSPFNPPALAQALNSIERSTVLFKQQPLKRVDRFKKRAILPLVYVQPKATLKKKKKIKVFPIRG